MGASLRINGTILYGRLSKKNFQKAFKKYKKMILEINHYHCKHDYLIWEITRVTQMLSLRYTTKHINKSENISTNKIIPLMTSIKAAF